MVIMAYWPTRYCVKAFYRPNKYIGFINIITRYSMSLDKEITEEQTFVSLEKFSVAEVDPSFCVNFIEK